MTKIKDIPAALSLFEEAATKHAAATKEGDYKTGNKNYHKKVKAVSYLRGQDSIDGLLQYLNHDNVGENIAEILELAGYSVVTAENGKVGIGYSTPPNEIFVRVFGSSWLIVSLVRMLP